MHRFVALYPQPDDVEAFRDYYQRAHLPLVKVLPGIRDISYSFDVGVLQGETRYACFFEAEFEDKAALLAALGSPEGAAAAADIPNFATAGVILLGFEFTSP